MTERSQESYADWRPVADWKPVEYDIEKLFDALKPVREAYESIAPAGRQRCEQCEDGKVPVTVPTGQTYYLMCPHVSLRCLMGKRAAKNMIRLACDQIKSIIDLPVLFHPYLESPELTIAVKGARKWNWERANFLVFHGAHGTGKSFGAAYSLYLLLRARLLPNWNNPMLWNTRNFDALWTSAYRIATIDGVYEAARKAGYLVIDDLGSEDPTAHCKNRLTDVISRRYDMRKITILTMNEDVMELENLYGRRMYDRVIGCGTTIYCGGESLRLSIVFDEKGTMTHGSN
jgi:hypothetical protein